MIPWALRKQLTYFFFFAVIVVAATGFFIYKNIRPTCDDGKQNQNEEGVDCGGVCASQCLPDIQKLIVHWSRPIKIKDGIYDAAALVENPNLVVGIKKFVYQFKLYDKNNVLVSVRQGETAIGPGEKFLIFEPNLDVGARVPHGAFLEVGSVNWEREDPSSADIYVIKKGFSGENYQRLAVIVGNRSLESARNIKIAVILYDEAGNIIGASVSFIDELKGEGKQEVAFTWPEPFEKAPASSEIFLRQNL